MGYKYPPLGAFVLSLCTIITRVLISKAKNKIQRWWKEQKAQKTLLDIDEHFFLYATTNIHIAASFFVYNKLLPWSPNPKRQIFFQMTFFLSFSHISNAENLLILLCLHWVSKGWIETKTLVSQCTILNILVLRLISPIAPNVVTRTIL